MIHLTTLAMYLIILYFTFQTLKLCKKLTLPHDGDAQTCRGSSTLRGECKLLLDVV